MMRVFLDGWRYERYAVPTTAWGALVMAVATATIAVWPEPIDVSSIGCLEAAVPSIEKRGKGGAQWPPAAVIEPSDWLPLRLRPGDEMLTEAAAMGSERYRLAGTLLIRSDEGTIRYGRAIIDDMQERRQLVLAKQESVGELQVLRIDWNRVIASVAGRLVTLTMKYAGGGVSPPAEPSSVVAAALAEPPLEVNRFGRRIQQDRWLIEREAVFDYYRELRNDAVRVARLYESFRPVRDRESGRITGYQLNILSEADFLNAVGLQEGDVVRAVNSMPMTSQSRAEFFIGEFLKENLNAIVLDIERNRQPQKLVYLIR